MSERSQRISKLLNSQKSRTAYIKAKLAVLVPAQIRALRLKSTNPPMPYQRDLGREAELHQSRISMFETPGMANVTLETLAKIAAGLRSGLIVKFVPFNDMLRWENCFSPDTFNVRPRLEEDEEFLNPARESNVGNASAASSKDESNEMACSSEDHNEIQAMNMRKPPRSEVFAQEVTFGGSSAQ